MLQPIEQLVPDPFDRLFCYFDAIDPESGAYLFRSGGRTKSGRAPKYVLILPNQTIEERGGLLKFGTFDNHERKFIRAWTWTEALSTANRKLAKMLAARARAAA